MLSDKLLYAICVNDTWKRKNDTVSTLKVIIYQYQQQTSNQVITLDESLIALHYGTAFKII